MTPHQEHAAGAPFHYAPASRFTRQRAVAQLQRYAKQGRTIVAQRYPLLLFLFALVSGGCSVAAQPTSIDILSLTSSDWEVLTRDIGAVQLKAEAGHIAGVEITRPGVVLKALGIEPGDVVVQLNGESLADKRGAERFAVALAHATSFELTVRSNGGRTHTIRCANRLTRSCSGP